MENTAALVVVDDSSPAALTLRKYAALLAVGSPFVCDDGDGPNEPNEVDAVAADIILREGAAAAANPEMLERVRVRASAMPADAAAELLRGIALAMAPFVNAMRGMAGAGGSGKPTLGLVPALLLRCAKDYGWTVAETLDTPLATLMLVVREDLVQRGKSMTYETMALIDKLREEQGNG